MRATATQATPSPRPIHPIPSFELALTLTGAPSTSERLRCICSRCGPRRGASHTTVTSTLVTGPGTHFPPEVAETRGPEHGVDDGVRDDVRVGMPVEPLLVLDLDAAEDEPPSGGEPVTVVADPDPQPSGSVRRCRPSNTAISSIPQSRIFSTARW